MAYHARIAHLAKAQARESSQAHGRAINQGLNEDSGWLITLSDLTLLLLCFLAVWYVKNQEQHAAAPSANSAAQSARANTALKKKAHAARAHDADWNALREEIEEFIAAAGMTGEVTIDAAPNEILLSFKDTIPFASGKADLRPEALPMLEKVAAVSVSRPALQLAISGHTDDRPISTAEFPSNWELSSARASRVARYLIEKGVAPARIAVHGFAYHRPRVANNNRASRGANRRVDLRLVRGSEWAATQNSGRSPGR
jgi:chemotaxis protein MotB